MPTLPGGGGGHISGREENFWGIRCKGCGKMHPTAMRRREDRGGRFEAEEAFGYRCFLDDRVYDYVGAEEVLYHLADSTSS
jgi:hypothetical protein